MTTAPSYAARRARDVWFVTGSQALYGEETLRQVAGQSTAIVRYCCFGLR